MAKESPAYQERAVMQHRTDSLTILMLLGLLLLTVLTVWLFKHRRFRFVHETGLSMIYGMAVGAIIRYSSSASNPPMPTVLIREGAQYTSLDPPDYLQVYLNRTFEKDAPQDKIIYSFKGAVTAKLQEPPLEQTVTFSPELFFNVLLPVIIFEAGYSMKKKHFFKNLGAILMYALLGTTISCVVIGAIMYGLTQLMKDIDISLNDCFFFGAFISATDPVTVLALFNDLHVDVDLYALVFGESVLNDAVAIVLSESVETYGELSTEGFSFEAFLQALGKFVGVFAGAFAIGCLMGILTAILTKFTKIRDFPLLETALFFLMSYSTFQAAEAAELTGIVAVLFCGITQAHYTYNNLSDESKVRTKQIFELMNFLAENFVFLYIGVSIFTFEPHKWHAGFIFASFLAILVARFCNVYPMSFLLNLGRSNKIRPNFQHMMMFSGLRGAIAFALAIRETDSEARQLMASATMVIVLATVILCGGFTTPMLQWLQIRVGVDEAEQELQNMAGASVRNALNTQRQYSSMTGPTRACPHPNCPAHPRPASQPRPGQPRRQAPSARSNTSSADAEFKMQASPLLDSQANAPSESLPSGNRLSEKAWLVRIWYNFDSVFMKPLLTNSRPTLMETLPPSCARFAQMFTTEEQLTQGDTHSLGGDSDTDIILDPNNFNINVGGNGSAGPDDGDPGLGGDIGLQMQHPRVAVTPSSRTEPLQVVDDDGTSGFDLGIGGATVPTRVNLQGPRGHNV